MERSLKLFLFLIVLQLLSAPAALSEGAIAVGKVMPRQWFGVVINKTTLQQARSDAVAICSQHGPNCSVFATFRNACVAITWGATRGRAGYAAVTRATIEDARRTAISNCYSQGMSSCEIKYSACDTVDEAQLARERNLQEQRAAYEAEQRRRAAEAAALQAQERERVSRKAEEDAKRRAEDAQNRTPSTAKDNPHGISNTKALGLGLALMIGVFIAILKQGHPQIAGWTVLIMPLMSFLLYVFFGIEVKDEITIAEWPVFAPVFGGVVVAALMWKLHA